MDKYNEKVANDKILKDHLTNDEREKLSYLKKRDMVKLMKTTMKVYNTLCPICKPKVLRNPRLKLADYCLECRDKVYAEYEDLLEKIN